MAGIHTSSEAQIAAMLNMFEYLDYHMGEPGTDFGTLVRDAERYLRVSGQLTESRQDMLTILQDGLRTMPELSRLTLRASDHGNGIEADAFTDGNDAYVVYRGTGDGKWIDNGRGMTEELTESQRQASDFYDRVVRDCGLDEHTNLTVTGHSKGGNNAQTATLNADNRLLVDRCISFDGQGMSDAAIDRYSRMPGYEEQRNKMYGINGENDVVNELGIKVIPNENTVYVKTNTDSSQLAETHMLEYLFHREDGSFSCTFNDTTSQGELGQYAHRLSEILMSMPEEIRDSCAVTIMQLIEMGEETAVGYNGDHASVSDIDIFIHYGIPMVIYSLIGTEEGREALGDILEDLVRNYIEEHGVWETAGVVMGTVMTAVVILPFVWPYMAAAAAIAAGIVCVVNRLARLERLGEILRRIGEYIQQCLDAIEEFFDQISDWIKHKITGRPIIDSADFSVNIGTLRYAADELEQMYGALQRAASRVNSVKRSLPMRGLAASAVKARLNYVSLCANQVSGRARTLGRAVDRTADAYVRYEQRIAANV